MYVTFISFLFEFALVKYIHYFQVFYNLILDITSPVNIGNPEEHTISEFADLIIKLTSSQSRIVHMPAAQVLNY